VEVVENAPEVIEITDSEWIYKNERYSSIETLLYQL
jgi:hypothetical protein